MGKNHDILGVGNDATPQQIRKAYLALVKRYHPDISKEPHAKDKLQQINAAYHALTNPEAEQQAENSFLEVITRLTITYKDESLIIIESGKSSYDIKKELLDYLHKNLKTKEGTIQDQDLGDFYNQKLEKIDLTGLINIVAKNELFFDTTTKPTHFYNPYANLTDEQLMQKVDQAKSTYAEIKDLTTDKAFLWVAKKPGAADIFILGTCHVINKDPKDIFGDAIQNILQQVDIVFFEVKSDLQPTIQIGDITLYCYDNIVAQMAFDIDKTVGFLETRETIERCGGENYLATAKKALKALGKGEDILTQNFLTSITPPTLPSIHIIATENRNKFWLSTILEQSKENRPQLIVCGAAHNYQRYGLPNLLANEGYTLTPLMKTSPVPKSQQLRDAMYGNIAIRQMFLKPQLQNNSKKTEKDEPELQVALRKK